MLVCASFSALWWDVAVKKVLWATVQPSLCNLCFLGVFALCVIHKGTVAFSSLLTGNRPSEFISHPLF